MDARLTALDQLFEEMGAWGRRYDPAGVRRRVDAVDAAARLLVLGEAHAGTQVRLTGVNWHAADGRMGAAGRHLERVLRCVGYPLAPPRPIELPRGTVRARESGYASAYTTDLFPCYPGARAPRPAEIKDALDRGFLCRELEALRPAVVLRLGDKAYQASYRHLLGRIPPGTLSVVFRALTPSSTLERLAGAHVVPFLHPSPASGYYNQWAKAAGPRICEQPQVRALAHALASA
jgi:uracil-DNA glycosylase